MPRLALPQLALFPLSFSSAAPSGLDTVDATFRILDQDGDYTRDEWSQLPQSGTTGDHDDDRDREFLEVLLVLETPGQP